MCSIDELFDIIFHLLFISKVQDFATMEKEGLKKNDSVEVLFRGSIIILEILI